MQEELGFDCCESGENSVRSKDKEEFALWDPVIRLRIGSAIIGYDRLDSEPIVSDYARSDPKLHRAIRVRILESIVRIPKVSRSRPMLTELFRLLPSS